jgi:hypothetical protein
MYSDEASRIIVFGFSGLLRLYFLPLRLSASIRSLFGLFYFVTALFEFGERGGRRRNRRRPNNPEYVCIVRSYSHEQPGTASP